MPIVTFNKKYLKSLLGSDIDDGKLVEEIGKLGINIEKTERDEISVEISSNRPDMLSAVGFARALQLYFHRSKKYRYLLKDRKPLLEVRVGRNAKKVREFIAAFAVLGVHFTDDSLTELINAMEKFTDTYGRSRKKIAIGMHNLDVIKAPLYYDAYKNESYVPLNHAKPMTFEEVMKNTEKGRKYRETIPDTKEGLYPALKDSIGTLTLIPILNSNRTKVTVSTTNLLLDVTGPSEYMVNKTADMLAAVFMDLGGEIKAVRVSYPEKNAITPLMAEHEMLIPVQLIESDIGVKIGPNNAASLASKMGYNAVYIGKKVRFVVPAYRLDVINEQDVIEDIAIAYGYDYINPVPVRSVLAGALTGATIFRSDLADMMLGLGFNQMINSLSLIHI